uniref:Parathyroid hormone n=1 Tax=Poecilia latipinna TaxID=48699 RepID=A0A3B3UQR7_9TELE
WCHCRCLLPPMLLKSDININCEICSLMTGEGNPRSISEVQFMHNVQEHKQVGERQDWLQEKLKKIIIPSPKPQYMRKGKTKKKVNNSFQP